MKDFFARIKAICLTVAAWFDHWTKDLVLHFTLADNITSVIWIIMAVTLGMFTSIKWAYLFSAALTIALILFKDCALDERADWRDIAAGFIGLTWSLLKIWLLCFCWLTLHQVFM